MNDRPQPPHPPTSGCHWEVAESSGWRLTGVKRCRAGAGYRHGSCGRQSVAELDRGRGRQSWWAYCGEHLYDNWIEDGRIVHWRLVEVDDVAS